MYTQHPGLDGRGAGGTLWSLLWVPAGSRAEGRRAPPGLEGSAVRIGRGRATVIGHRL